MDEATCKDQPPVKSEWFLRLQTFQLVSSIQYVVLIALRNSESRKGGLAGADTVVFIGEKTWSLIQRQMNGKLI